MSWLIERQLQEQQGIVPGIVPSDITIAIPHRGNFSAKWVMGFQSLKVPFATSPTVLFESGQPIDISRNIACTKALQSGSKYLFFVDSDVILKSDTLEQLLSVKMPIVSACYRSRGEPYQILANIDKKPIDEKIITTDGNIQFVKVHEVGMGACLIDIKVLKNMGARLDEWRCFLDHSNDSIKKEVAVYNNKTAIANGYKCTVCKQSLIARFFWSRHAMQNINALSEDYWFCMQARQQGFPIVIKPNTWVNHETTFAEVGEKGVINPLSSVASVE